VAGQQVLLMPFDMHGFHVTEFLEPANNAC
jgi:hypothetical protein